MKMKKKYLLSLAVLLSGSSLLLTSCSEDDQNISRSVVDYTSNSKVYVLNQGSWGGGNSSLTSYDIDSKTTNEDEFSSVNGRNLGELAQDMGLYGSKLWITVSGENTLEIVNAATCVSVKQLSLPQPRHIAFEGGYAYVTLYTGYMARIDTATFEVTTVATGLNPEGIAVSNHKIYVANSGGLHSPVYEKTISIFNVSTLSLIETKEVIVNPSKFQKVDDNTLMLQSIGNYGDVAGGMQTINTQTDEISLVNGLSVGNYAVKDAHTIFYYVSEYDANWQPIPSAVSLYDLTLNQKMSSNITTDSITFKNPYALAVSPYNGSVCLADAIGYGVDGEAFLISKSGVKEASFPVGLYPCAIAFTGKK